MTLQHHITLNNILMHYRQSGFNRTFTFDGHGLKCLQTNRYYSAIELQIIEYHRVTDQKDQNKGRAVFALQAMDGEKGIALSALAPQKEIRFLEFMDKVKVMLRH